MANKDQKRGNREARKPKQPKAKPAAAAPSFVASQRLQGQSKPGQKR